MSSTIVDELVQAFGIPQGARVDQRVPKKYFMEQGAPTPTDKRYVQEGIEEVFWLASLKPSTIGVERYKDDVREYVEIQVLSVMLRPDAKRNRLVELIHRAIPYPLILFTRDDGSISLSLVHIRDSKAEKETTVLDGQIVEEVFPNRFNEIEKTYLRTLPIAGQHTNDLFGLYNNWIDRTCALTVARKTGRFELKITTEDTQSRNLALKEHERIQREIAELSTKAKKEKQINHRVELNMNIKKLELQLTDLLNKM